MSTGEKLIRATQWQPLDGSSSNAAPGFGVIAGSQTQKIQVPILAFDGAGSTIEYACYTTRVPVDYAAGGNLKILWMANSTSGTVKWQVQTAAVTPADSDTPLEHAWGTAATLTPSVDTGEARRLVETTITMNMDSAAAGDLISFLISRDPANDTCTADAELISAAFAYSADDQAGSPIGVLDYNERTSDVTGITNSNADLTGLTVTFNGVEGRSYRLTLMVNEFDETTPTVPLISVIIATSGNTQITYMSVGRIVTGSAFFHGANLQAIVAPGTGTFTYKGRAIASLGGTAKMVASSTQPSWMMVEDLGLSA